MMELYHTILQPPQHAISAVSGRFTKCEEIMEEIVLNLGTFLRFIRIYPEKQERVQNIATLNIYAHVLNIDKLPIYNSDINYLVVTSDSGNIIIFDLTNDTFQQYLCLPFGRTGLRRNEPGYYLSSSPCGRAILTSALEKTKLAWSVTKNNKNLPELQAPLENTRNATFVVAMCALDVGYETPKFATIERYFKPKDGDKQKFNPEIEPKYLSFYQLDTAINYLVRSARREDERQLPPSANHLVPVPGPLFSLPGGVIVCSRGMAQYFSNTGEELAAVPIPHRRGSDDSIIVASTSFHTESDDGPIWLVLLMNQYGDLFIANSSPEFKVRYYDTIKPSTSIVLTSVGILASFGNTEEYFIVQDVDPETDETEFDPLPDSNHDLMENEGGEEEEGKAKHLVRTEKIDTMNRLTKMVSLGNGEIASVHGSGNLSSLKITKKGIPTHEIIRVPAGGSPKFVRALKMDAADRFDRFVLISTDEKTRIVEYIEENGVLKIRDYEGDLFRNDVKTVDAFVLPAFGTSSIAQIHTEGLHFSAKDGAHEWSRGVNVLTSGSNSSQILIAFEDGVITLLETDESAIPQEISSSSNPVDGIVRAIALPQPPRGVKRTDWAAVAASSPDNAIHRVFVLSIAQESRWEVASQLVVRAPVTGLGFVRAGANLLLYAGHSDGTATRASLDESGGLSTPRVLLLGRHKVSLSPAVIDGQHSLILTSSNTWIAKGITLEQIAAPKLNCAAQAFLPAFVSDSGFVGTGGGDLVLFEVPDWNIGVSTKTIPLQSTPRQLVFIPGTRLLVSFLSEVGSDGVWRSLIVFASLEGEEIVHVMEVDDGMMFTSAAFIKTTDDRHQIGITCALNLKFNPMRADGGLAMVLEIPFNGEPSLILKTPLPGIPRAIASFDSDSVLVGHGQILELLSLGRTQMLRRSQTRALPYMINFVHSFGSRIIVGDSSESFHLLKYDRSEQVLSVFADDMVPRFPIASVALDPSSVAFGDRFGTFAVLRLPPDISDEAEFDPSGVGHAWEHPEFAGARAKMELAASFHIGAPITGVSLYSGPGGEKAIIYATVNGEVGSFSAIRTSTEATVLRKVGEKVLARTKTPLGRRVDAFRGYYQPGKCVVDADIVRGYTSLPEEEQKEIAADLSLTSFDIAHIIAKYDGFF